MIVIILAFWLAMLARSLPRRQLVVMVHARRVRIQVCHVNCAHAHEGRVHAVALSALFHLRGADQAHPISCGEWRLRERHVAHVVTHATSHRAELQAADHAGSTATGRAHIVARAAVAALPIFVLQVAKVAR
mgnify:FL=1|jgi:hypothetical protein